MNTARLLRLTCIVALLVLSLPFLSLPARSQQSVGSIIGKIRLASPEQAQDLMVRAEEATTEAVIEETEVDSGGNFALRNLPFATYDIYIRNQEHSSFARRVRVNSAVPVQMTFDSLPSFSGQDVTIVDTHVESTQPTVHTLYTAPVIQSLPVPNTQKQIEAILLNSPGVVPDEDGRLHMRGEDANIQFVIDGIPVTMNQTRIYTPLLNAHLIETADLLRGSLNPEYGVATSGVLNVTSRSGFDAPSFGHAEYNYGTFGNNSKSVDFGGHIGQAFAYYGGYADFRSDRYLDPVRGFDPNHTAGNGNDYWGKLNIIASSKVDIVGLGLYSTTIFDVPNQKLNSPQDQKQNLRSYLFGARVNYNLTPSSVLSALGYTRSQRADLTSNGMDRVDMGDSASRARALANNERYFVGAHRSNNESGGQLEYSAKTDWFDAENEFKLGVGGEVYPLEEYLTFAVTDSNLSSAYTAGGDPRLAAYDLSRGGSPFIVKDTSVTGKRFSGYIQDAVTTGKWTLAGGLRIDHYDLLDKETGISPRLNTVYRATEDLILRASYNRMFNQAPLENILVSSSPQAAALTGEEQQGISRLVRSEKAHVVEIGGNYRVSNIFSVDLTGYGKMIDDFLVKVELGNSGVIFPANIKQGFVAGGELALTMREVSGFSGNLAFSTIISKGLIPNDGTTPFAAGLVLGEEGENYKRPWTGEDMFNTEHNQLLTAAFNLRYENPLGVSAVLGGRFDSGLPFDLAGPNGVGLTPEESRAELLRRNYTPDVIDMLELTSETPGSPDKSVAPHATFDLSLGADLSKLVGLPLRLTGTVINVLDTKYLYKFESTFGGTHYGVPRSFLLRIELIS